MTVYWSGWVLIFFFSSRRRHTRWTGDWSSDVCSSDLAELARRRVALDALLGETDDLEARQTELGEHRARGPELAEAAVDHQQVGQPAALARVAEAPAQHLGHRREVVRALDGADAVAAVAVLVGRPLVEGDDGAHGLAA